MGLSINTPALLFPAISLLMLAYTNRFLALASLIRSLHAAYKDEPAKNGVLLQIKNLRLRLRLIRLMQGYGVMSLFLCVLSMFFIYGDLAVLAGYAFACSLVLMLISLFLSLSEINISTKALEIELSDIEELQKPGSIINYIRERFEKDE